MNAKICGVIGNETMLFYEDFVKMSKKKRSKSLDQIHTIVLSDEIYERRGERNEQHYVMYQGEHNNQEKLKLKLSLST